MRLLAVHPGSAHAVFAVRRSAGRFCLLRLFLDGQLVGQISNTSVYSGEDGTPLLVSGGAPAALSGPIHLCTRADNNNTRYFDGKLAYLGEYVPTLHLHISSAIPCMTAVLHIAGHAMANPVRIF